jgi:hypothetical protein
MKTKQDFVKIIDQTADQYSQIAALRRAGDPRYFQLQESIATMLAMLSQQVEVAMMEPFDKVRDATVLADAALKGIIQRGSPARVKVKVINSSKTNDFSLIAGRLVTDADSNPYVVDKPVVIPRAASDTAPGIGYVELVQSTTRKISHTVTVGEAFYTIDVPMADDGSYLAQIQVKTPSGADFEYAPGFTNVAAGQRVYTVETDAQRRVALKFGIAGVVGYEPQVGEVLDVYLTTTRGNVQPKAGSPFTLEYAYTPAESMINMEFVEMMISGADPLGIPALRELARYPSIYNVNAVYLGEFDFLVRRTITNLPFLSIWNEQIEEQARGASVDNINRLFVAFVQPVNSNKDAMQAEIKRVLLRADDSYDVFFVPPVTVPIVVNVTANVARVHDADSVKAQISTAILKEFGPESPLSLQGMMTLQYKRVYEFLRARVPALQDSGSDFSVQIPESTVKPVPEHWRFVSPQSLSITIKPADYNIGGWGR